MMSHAPTPPGIKMHEDISEDEAHAENRGVFDERKIMLFLLLHSVMEYEEHEKRTWSVDFSRTEPKMLVSGSDDCKVKVWCTNQEASAINIDMKANICSIKYNPGSSYYVAYPELLHKRTNGNGTAPPPLPAAATVS
ncbi:hypothetical protein ZWY2020_046007 [Hordeum vulgare]|nr:hypothetical protein ZWY2020_046007 [Hordeum vulgare]